MVEDQKRKAAVALGRITNAKERLMMKYPLHAGILNRMPVACQPDVGTMAVTIRGEHVYLLYCPKFVCSIPVKELVGVLLHEVHHVIFNHLLMTSKEYPHKNALIIAQECSVNEFVMEPLPEGLILLKNFPELPALESTKVRYDRLVKMLPPQITISAKTLDNHTVWEAEAIGGSGEQREQAQKTIQDLVDGAMGNCKNGEVPKELLDAMDAHGCGSDPGGDIEGILAGGNGKVPWQTLLRRYIGQSLQVGPCYARPPRRFPHLLGIVPGNRRMADRPRVMAVIDTSGSISSEMLSLISDELTGLAKSHEVLVVEADYDIQRVYKYTKPIVDVWGRGGTSFFPIFASDFLNKYKPDLIVVMTDGCGPCPEKAPSVPVIWGLTGQWCRRPCEWGRFINID